MTAHLELRVFDRLASGALIGLESLLRSLLFALPEAAQWTWRVMSGAWGHGSFVCSVEDRLNAGQSVSLSTAELLNRLRASGEYFEDVRLRHEQTGVRVRLAVVDSAFLQLVADPEVVASCANRFDRTEVLQAGN